MRYRVPRGSQGWPVKARVDPGLRGVEAFDHPAVREWHRWLLDGWEPRERVVLLTPCSNVKPYPRSPMSEKVGGFSADWASGTRRAGDPPPPYITSGDPVPMHLIQRAYRRCKYPYGAMVRLLLEEAGLDPGTVVDLTYGLGKFWSCWRPPYLVGYDFRRLDWVAAPDEFRKAPAWAARHYYKRGAA